MTSITNKINWPAPSNRTTNNSKLATLFFSLVMALLFSGQALTDENVDSHEEMSNPHGMPVVLKDSTRFAPCPKRPNCVSSMFFQDKGHYILPLSIMPIGEKSRNDRLLEVINSFDNIKVAEMDGTYLRVEFTSKWLGFVDDVEFLINDSHTDVRSASRIGYSDMGVNRRRVEEIRSRLQAQESNSQASESE